MKPAFKIIDPKTITTSPQSTSHKQLKLLAAVTVFALIAVCGLSFVFGNSQNGGVGNTLASAQEPADINNDNKVDVFDLSILLGKWNTTDTLSDLNKDGTVNVFDLSMLLGKWGTVGGGASSCLNSQHTPGGSDGMGGCWPAEYNTGYPHGLPGDTRTPVTLTNYSGPCTITVANTVIDKKTVNCDLMIRTSNVTITNSNINGRIDNDGNSAYSYNVSDSTIHVADINFRGLMSSNYIATRVDVSGGQSMAWCQSCTIQDSYLHNPLEDPEGAAANHAAHNSTVRVSDHAIIKHNTLWCYVKEYPQPDGQDTSGCSANQTAYSHDGSPPFNSRMEANLYMPTSGWYRAYGGSTSGALTSVHDIVFINNVFKRTAYMGQGGPNCGIGGAITSFDSNRPGNQWINNRWDDGTIVPSAY